MLIDVFINDAMKTRVSGDSCFLRQMYNRLNIYGIPVLKPYNLRVLNKYFADYTAKINYNRNK